MTGMAAVEQMANRSSGRVRTISPETLDLAAELIRRGEVIVIPTDTVYGVACDPFNAKAIEGIFAAKHRPHTKALQVLLPSVASIAELGLRLPDPLGILADAFLPGPFSPICEADEHCSLATVRIDDGSRTQGVRVPIPMIHVACWRRQALLRHPARIVRVCPAPKPRSRLMSSWGIRWPCTSTQVRPPGRSPVPLWPLPPMGKMASHCCVRE